MIETKSNHKLEQHSHSFNEEVKLSEPENLSLSDLSSDRFNDTSGNLKIRCKRSNLKTNECLFNDLRGDVVFKTILRKMRKTLNNEFNNCTNYMKCKNSKSSSDFVTQCLEKYASKI